MCATIDDETYEVTMHPISAPSIRYHVLWLDSNAKFSGGHPAYHSAIIQDNKKLDEFLLKLEQAGVARTDILLYDFESKII